jgi:hypothetical protein
MPFVSITRLRVWSWRYLPGFLIQSFRAARQARLRLEALQFLSFAMSIALFGRAIWCAD